MKIFSLKCKPYVIMIICFGLFLFFILNFLIPHNEKGKNLLSEKAPDASSNLELNDAIITRLILSNLPDDIPLSNLVVHISSDSTVKIDCTVEKDTVNEFINNKNPQTPSYIKLITNFLPDSVPISLSLKLAVDAQKGELALTPKGVTVNDMEIRESILPADFEISINQAINSLISKEDKKISSVNISDGHILINLTEKKHSA